MHFSFSVTPKPRTSRGDFNTKSPLFSWLEIARKEGEMP
jgi:hypothetical protein